MDGDLSLSQSFGGLRIANPDKSSPNSTQDETFSLNQTVSPHSTPGPVSTQLDANSDSPAPSPSPFAAPFRTSSPLGFDPNTFSTKTPPPSRAPNNVENTQSVSPTQQSSYAQRYSNRQSIGLTYQAQQQAQFPQYPTMIPQNQRHPSNSTRPTSAMYVQPPASNASIDPPFREGSYRIRSESSQSPIVGLPKRSDSRGASTAMQAGVPTREGSHTDRSYRQSQPMYNGNAALPPRKSSRGMGNGPPSDQARSVSGSIPEASTASEAGIPQSSEDWQDRGAAVGVRQEMDANGRPILRHVKKGVKDFQFGRTLGEGSYSVVIAASDRQMQREYAIKVLDKRHIIKEKKIKYVNIEKDALNRLTEHPGVVRLYYTFQDEQSLYFVLDLASGGELLGVLKKMTTFDEECTRFYGAQILDTIDYMHARGVIHRDLKPENVLLDDQMHVKITDFGTAKILDIKKRTASGSNGASIADSGNPLDGSEDNRANSFVGTAEYVSPELLTDKNACKASDLWAFGCIIYQLLAGRPPFKASNEYLTFQKIVALEYQFPIGFPDIARDLVERLLVLDPSRRLSIEHIKNHDFFRGVSWGRGLWKQKAPKLKSFNPSLAESTRHNGQQNGKISSYPPNIKPSHSTTAAFIDSGITPTPNGNSRPGPRIITELPPPSQLDIEWSPVLTRSNERILKLGNQLVLSAPGPQSPSGKSGTSNGDSEAPRRFSRFFGGHTPKKQPRFVMVTSSARVIIAAAGGSEKKAKTEFSILSGGCIWRKLQDSKGLTFWCIEMHDKHFSFEDPKSATSDGSATSAMAQEWLDALDQAREMALSQNMSNSYSGEEAFKALQTGAPSTPRSLDLDAQMSLDDAPSSSSRNLEVDPLKGRKRFSKRQSKSGLAAVF